MARVYDCFTYFNEDLLLDLRFRTLAEVVDVFVIVEATRTFTGRPKPLRFDAGRYPEFADRIRHVVVDDLEPDATRAWQNEFRQRNAFLRGLDDAADDDRVIVADLDEIPHPDAIRAYDPRRLVGTFVQRFFSYRLNNLAVRLEDPNRERDWIRCKITTAGHLRRFFGTPQEVRIRSKARSLAGRWRYLRRKLGTQRLRPGGWHFSWAMTPEEMIVKIESFAHTEVDLPELKSIPAIETAIREGRDILGKNERFRLIPIDETFPAPLRETPERYRSLCTPLESSA